MSLKGMHKLESSIMDNNKNSYVRECCKLQLCHKQFRSITSLIKCGFMTVFHFPTCYQISTKQQKIDRFTHCYAMSQINYNNSNRSNVRPETPKRNERQLVASAQTTVNTTRSSQIYLFFTFTHLTLPY